MSVLRLSNDLLPADLKQCFIYCSLFPKDYGFSISKLVRLWTAQGFIQPREDLTMEEVGADYFNELFCRSFFEKTPSGKYVIHDLLHDLAKGLSDGEVFMIVGNKPVEIPTRARHLSICSDNLFLVCSDQHAKKNLRSLVVSDCSDNSLEILKELKGLRVLILDNFVGKLSSKSIRKMLHLRYLEIQDYQKRCSHKLPESLGKLYHLQVLNVGKIWSIPSCCVLPTEINRVTNLCHLDAVTKGIRRIGMLTSLQNLCFHVNQEENGYEIGQLKDMSNLRYLIVKGLESIENKGQATEAMLKNKEHLKGLNLIWKDHTYLDGEVLEGLQPHQNLEDLRITKYGGNCPSWWRGNQLSHLRKIYIKDCSNWEILPPLGQLHFLKVLSLQKMDAVRRIGPEFYGNYAPIAFRSLETLILNRMSEMMEWCKVESCELCPRLSYLYVNSCPKLRGSLFLPSQLKELIVGITESGDESLPMVQKARTFATSVCCFNVSILEEWVPWRNLTSVETLTITFHTTIFPPRLEVWFQHLSSLQSLCFSSCNQLESLPPKLLKSLSALQNLSFSFCNKLQSLPKNGLPSSLLVLKVDHCCQLVEWCRKDDSAWRIMAPIATIMINGKEEQQRDKPRSTAGFAVKQRDQPRSAVAFTVQNRYQQGSGLSFLLSLE